MKFSIGYNHDSKFFNLLDVYKDNIEAVYFPMPLKYSGSGRILHQSKSYEEEIAQLIKKCRSLGIKTQLLLNATCVGESGLEKIFFSKIIEYIRKLKRLGLTTVVFTNPSYLAEFKKQMKGVEIEASVNCYVKTVEHALYLKELGADVLVIDRDINRNIPLIKEIKDRTGLKIRLLLNEGCLRNCPFRNMHYNFIAHRKKRSEKDNKRFLKGLLNERFADRWCIELFSKNPARIFSVPFIPPNALKYYEGIADYFKISTRVASTDLIELRLKAYIDQEFNGNLVSLLDCPGLIYFSYIDSIPLNKSNFFEKMLKCTGDCEKCHYCHKLVEEAVVTDSRLFDLPRSERIKEIKKAISIYERVLKTFPREGSVYLGLARAYLALNKDDEALKAANKVLELGYMTKEKLRSVL